MVKPLVLVGFAIPSIIAILLLIPLITKPDIPFSAANPNDKIHIEYTQHHLLKISDGIVDRIIPQKSEILEIKNNGDVRYYVTENGKSQPAIITKINDKHLKRLVALIKETGFMAIPAESFPLKDDLDNYTKLSLKISLNGKVSEIRWLEQNATEKFIPPIISQVEFELNKIINGIQE